MVKPSDNQQRARELVLQISQLTVELAKVLGEPGDDDQCSRGPHHIAEHERGGKHPLCGVERYPCSDTCMHEDATTPGHPERVKERSEAVKAITERILPGPDVVDGDPGTRGPVRRVAEGARRRADAYAEGAEAMRAACLKVIEEETISAFQREALTDAIKKATP